MKEELSKEEEELVEMVAINDDDIYSLAGKRSKIMTMLPVLPLELGVALAMRMQEYAVHAHIHKYADADENVAEENFSFFKCSYMSV